MGGGGGGGVGGFTTSQTCSSACDAAPIVPTYGIATSVVKVHSRKVNLAVDLSPTLLDTMTEYQYCVFVFSPLSSVRSSPPACSASGSKVKVFRRMTC